MIIAPQEFVSALRDGLTVPTPDGRIFTDMEWGPALQRGGSDAQTVTVPIQLALDTPRIAYLLSFYSETLAKGSLPFCFPNQLFHNHLTLEDEYAPTLDDEGNPYMNTDYWVVRFAKGGAPVVGRMSARYRKRVSFALEVMW